MSRGAIVLFSGGADSTLVAARVAEERRFDEIVLLTYMVPVSCMDENARRNIPSLEHKYPGVRFTHEMIPIDGIISKVMAAKKIRSVLKYGLIEASFCLHCRLSMYVRTIMYCVDKGIDQVFDGSNVTMALWVDQTTKGAAVVDHLFAEFGIAIEHPVFYYVGDDLFDLAKYYMNTEDPKRLIHKSTSHELHDLGITNHRDMKSDYYASYRAQPVCLGVVMSLLHSLGLTLPFKSYEEFNARALRWYSDKVAAVEELLRAYKINGANSPLGRACRPSIVDQARSGPPTR